MIVEEFSPTPVLPAQGCRTPRPEGLPRRLRAAEIPGTEDDTDPQPVFPAIAAQAWPRIYPGL